MKSQENLCTKVLLRPPQPAHADKLLLSAKRLQNHWMVFRKVVQKALLDTSEFVTA